LPRLDAVVDLILPHFQAVDAETRWRAVYPFTRHPMKAAVTHLRDRLTDADPTVRSLAARALRAAPVDSAGLRAVTLEALVGLLADRDARVRVNALGAIATYREPATISAIAPLTTHEHGNTRVAALQALGAIGGTSAADVIAPIVSDTSIGIGIRDAALAALLRASAERGLAAVQPLAVSSAWLERFHAARALGSSEWPAGAALLRRLARDKDPRVAAAALRSITASADSAAGVQPIFLEALAAGDPGIRAAAVNGLAQRPSSANMAALMEAYERARFDSVSTAALAIVDALAGLEDAGLPVARAFFLRFPPARDPLVQRRVALRLGPNGWGPPTAWAADRDASFYRSLVDRYVVPALRDQVRPRVVIGSPYGEIQLELDAADAPLTVLNFLRLADEGFFANGADTRERRWHRVVPNFVVQDGDPRGDGSGGPGYTIRDEINRLRYGRGVLGMAHAGADTGGSQFFITLSPQPHLDGGYTIFGHVAGGMDAVDRVTQEDPLHYIRVVR
jgi:cyclophilin family peptidyl-prolyl cis-trans isomerase/HEAT repeat protein